VDINPVGAGGEPFSCFGQPYNSLLRQCLLPKPAPFENLLTPPLTQTLLEEEKTDIKLENRRRQVAREILAATRDYQRQSFYIRELQEKVLLAKDNPLPKVPPEIPSLPECPRFDEIRLYLFARLQELAIDTMNGPIPEHVLLKYILTRRELVINGDEWRAFLYICNDRKFLFRQAWQRLLANRFSINKGLYKRRAK
jgi:hypothetical protein